MTSNTARPTPVLPTRCSRPVPVDILGSGMFALKTEQDIFGLTLIDGALVSPRELGEGLNLASDVLLTRAALRCDYKKEIELDHAPMWVQRAVKASEARRFEIQAKSRRESYQ